MYADYIALAEDKTSQVKRQTKHYSRLYGRFVKTEWKTRTHTKSNILCNRKLLYDPSALF